jgi:hypothetical protein
MDELLYIFGSDSIIVKDIKIVAFDEATFSLTAWWYALMEVAGRLLVGLGTPHPAPAR